MKFQKVALVHDWTIHMRGGEKVLDALAEIYPHATLYTLFCDRAKLSSRLRKLKIETSFLQWLPGIKNYYRWLLPLFPFAIKTMRIRSETQLVLSSSHCVAKGITIPKGALHVCYCHTPMRYAWVAENVYFRSFAFPLRILIRGVMALLRKWDKKVNRHVDLFIANSNYIRKRIDTVYGCRAEVVHPPYEDHFFHPTTAKRNYYFAISHFVPYKKIDIIIEAFNDLNKELIIAGSGPLNKVYRSLVTQPKIKFVGSVSDEKLRDLYSSAQAVIFPAEEDFGIVPLEAQACGTPVIAYGKGGTLESVKSGLFFDEQTPESLKLAVERFERESFPMHEIYGKISGFKRAVFLNQIQAAIQRAQARKNGKLSSN